MALQPYKVKLTLSPIDTHSEPTGKNYFNVRDATRYSSVSRWTLSRAVESGQLSCIKMNKAKSGKILFEKDELDRFLRAHTVKIGGAK